MKLISSPKSVTNLVLNEQNNKYFSHQHSISKAKDDAGDKTYIIKEPKTSDESKYANFQINAAYLERLSAYLYQYFSPNAKVAQVEIAETDIKKIAVASEFIENYHNLRNFNLVINNNQIQLKKGNRIITLDPQTFFRIFLTARLIDDYDAYGNGDNTGIIFKGEEAILAKIDTDALKFAHPDQNTREFYSPLGLITLISKIINKRYIDKETPDYITSYPLSFISYTDQGSSKDTNLVTLNALLELYIPGADVKDLLFDKLSYQKIKSNPILYQEFCKAIYSIVSVEDKSLAELIDSMIPQETENFILIRKALLQNLIIRREQLKHLYLLEFEFEKIGNEKGDELDFIQRLDLAAKRVSFPTQLSIIKKSIEDLDSAGLNDYINDYNENSIEKFRSTRNAVQAIKNAIDNVIKVKLKREIDITFRDASEEFKELILNNMEIIKYLLDEDNCEQIYRIEDINIRNDIICHKNRVLMTIDQAEIFLANQKVFYENMIEDEIIHLLSLDEFNLLKDLALGYFYNIELETLSIILMKHPQFLKILNEEISIYQTKDNELLAVTDNEDDDTSYLEAAKINALEKRNEILSSEKTSLLRKIIEQGNTDFALLLTSFGANFLPSEKDTNEYYLLQHLISEKILFNINNNIAASNAIDRNTNDQSDESHDFINALVSSIVDAVTNLPAGISSFLKQIPIISIDLLANELSQNRHHSLPYHHPGDDDFAPDGNGGGSNTFFMGGDENPITQDNAITKLGLPGNITHPVDDHTR